MILIVSPSPAVCLSVGGGRVSNLAINIEVCKDKGGHTKGWEILADLNHKGSEWGLLRQRGRVDGGKSTVAMEVEWALFNILSPDVRRIGGPVCRPALVANGVEGDTAGELEGPMCLKEATPSPIQNLKG